MTEVKIEKRKHIGLWLLIAFIVIGAIALFFIFRSNMSKGYDVQTESDSTMRGNNRAVDDYIQYVRQPNTMDTSHVFSSNAIIKLTAAIKSKATELDFDLSPDVNAALKDADSITQDPNETTHANSISHAAILLSQAMQNLQQSKFPNLDTEASEVVSAARAIDPDVLTLDQRDAVKTFFEKASILLERM